jgi:hypothetical protein
VAQCYKDKKGRTLDCWQEVEQLLAVTETVRQEFVASN